MTRQRLNHCAERNEAAFNWKEGDIEILTPGDPAGDEPSFEHDEAVAKHRKNVAYVSNKNDEPEPEEVMPEATAEDTLRRINLIFRASSDLSRTNEEET